MERFRVRDQISGALREVKPDERFSFAGNPKVPFVQDARGSVKRVGKKLTGKERRQARRSAESGERG